MSQQTNSHPRYTKASFWSRLRLVFDADRWQEIWMTITSNKSRSFLTAFGVFWGILMLVLMVGAGKALETGIFSQIEGFATNGLSRQSARQSPTKASEKACLEYNQQ